MRTNNKGFGLIEVIIVSFIVILLGIVGYLFATNMMRSGTQASESSLKVQAESLSDVPDVTKSSDLDPTLEALNNIDLDSSSSSDSNLLSSEASNL